MTPRPGTRWRCRVTGETHTVDRHTKRPAGHWVDMIYQDGTFGAMPIESWLAARFERVEGRRG